VRRRRLKPTSAEAALTRAGEKACSNTFEATSTGPRRERIPSVRCVTWIPPLDVGKDSPDVAVGPAQLLGGHLDLAKRLVEPLRELIHVPPDERSTIDRTTTRTTAATARAMKRTDCASRGTSRANRWDRGTPTQF